MLESRNAESSVPNRFRYVIVEYNPGDDTKAAPIGVIVQGAGKLLFRFLLPTEGGELLLRFSKDIVFDIEEALNKDKDEGNVQIMDRETGFRRTVSVTSHEYFEYLHSTFLNTVRFTEPTEIVANEAELLVNSLFTSHVLGRAGRDGESECLVTESLTDGLILLLYSRNNEPVEGSMKLQKLTFLLKKETPLGRRLTDDFEYTPYNYGPYSSDLESMVDVLQREGLVEIEEKPLSDTDAELDIQQTRKSETELGQVKKRTMRVFKLTKEGEMLAKELLKSLPPSELEELAKLKTRFNPYPARVIKDYVYKRYEDMTTKSKLRKQSQGRVRK